MSLMEKQSVRKTFPNPVEMLESEDHVTIQIPGNQTTTNVHVDVVSEWERSYQGEEITRHSDDKRKIEKVPPLLLKGEKGRRNREYYEPAVLSLGPYHHNRHDLAETEKYKQITLKEYCVRCEISSMDLLYNKVLEVVHESRMCYIDGSTDAYNDEEFSRMMLRDGCFILFFMECVAFANKIVLLNKEYLGALGFANVIRDIFLLENQIPFVVVQVLLDLRFPEDRGEEMLNGFFNYLNCGELTTKAEKVLENKQPLHLLELYRSYFISFWCSFASILTKRIDDVDDEDYNYVKRNQAFASVMELKAKWIFLKCNYDEYSNGFIKFRSRCCYGELELGRRAVTSNSKAIYLNMIAYELCPHNPNDFRVSTYVRVMKSLVIHPDDVKELRNKDILVHSLGRDEEVVKMYADIDAPAVNLHIYNHQLRVIRRQIKKHYKYKTWAAELVTEYFSSPWKIVALLVATAILCTSFVQTYFTIWPLPSAPA